ncbi:MAG: porin [Nitrospira sp.]|nr:porin [Nitrospira sp.]
MRTSWLFGGIVVSTTITLGLGMQANAQEAGSPEKSIEQRVEEMDQEIRILKRKRELEQEAAESAKKTTPIVKASSSGFSLESADGNNVIRFRGLIQVDQRLMLEGASDIRNRTDQRAGNLDANGFHDATDSWYLRRARPIIEGTLFGIYDFRFIPDFGMGTVRIFDAYIDARFHPAFKIRVGKYKPFVGLERLQSAADIKFIERSYVTNDLLPNRDLGITVHGDLFKARLNYAFGVMNGVNDAGNIDTGFEFDGRPELQGRLFAEPFVNDDSVLSGLGIGAAATYTDSSGERNLNFTDTSPADATRNGLPSYLSASQNTFFRYNSTAVADGNRIRVSPQAYYYIGSLGIISEYAQVIQDVSLSTGGSPPAGGAGSNTVITPNTGKTLHHQAWQVAVSYLLTGERASFRSVKPRQNFDFGKGWGAWEVVGRYHEIVLDPDTFKNPTGTSYTGAYANLSESAQRARSWEVGVNWYLNQNARVALNYTQTRFTGGAGDGILPINAAGTNVQDRPEEQTLFTRLQLAF